MPEAGSLTWLAALDRSARPVYLALADALQAAVRSGDLQPGERLPPQRAVAERLGIDLTTVTRAYNVARDRGLVEGTVGRGTYVSARAAEQEAGLVDLSMNLPPPPDGVSLAALIEETTREVLQRADAATLMSYHPGAGALTQRAAGAQWLEPVLGSVSPERVLLSGGAQTALAAALATTCRPGDTLAVEPLVYPGLKGVAAHQGLRLAPVPADGEGLSPEALDRLCAEQRPVALYVTPTMQNPTATTMGPERRRRIAETARRHGLWIVEDDPYSRLMAQPAPALATFAPDRTIHVATLSKCLSPGLRLGYVVCPDAPFAERMAAALRAVAVMPAPLMASVVTRWVRDGAAERLLAGVRREASARRRLAEEHLPLARGASEAIHVWLPLEAGWGPDRLRLAAQERGVSLVTADAFATAAAYDNGVRISLGGVTKRGALAEGLAAIGELLNGPERPRRLVV